MEIQFIKHNVKFTLSQAKLYKTWIEKVIKAEKQKGQSITYVFSTDAFVLKINQDFLQHDYFTDIITFPLSKKGAPLEAELYISIDRVKDNAKTMGVRFSDELSRVMVHGILHLCGYKDKTKTQVQEIRAREDYWLNKLQQMRITD